MNIVMMLVNPMTLNDLKTEMSCTSSELLHRLKELEEKRLVWKDDNNYVLTRVGKIIADKFDPNQTSKIIGTENVAHNNKSYYAVYTQDAIFDVNPKSGNVEIATYNIPNSMSVKLTPVEAQQIALKYANKVYTNFTNNNMTLVENNLIDGGSYKQYVFKWDELMNGVYTPNMVSVIVDPYTGSIISYVGVDNPITVNTTVPKITKNNAIITAKSAFNNINITHCETTLEVEDIEQMDQKLVWDTWIDGNSTIDGTRSGGWVIIDAINGTVLTIDLYA